MARLVLLYRAFRVRGAGLKLKKQESPHCWSDLLDVFGLFLAATITTFLVKQKPISQCQSARLFPLNLSSEPDPKFKYPLKFLRAEKPAVLVTNGVRRKVVFSAVGASPSMGEDMVGGPFFLYFPSTDVAPPSGLFQNRLVFRRCQGLTLASMRANFQLSTPPFSA
jgi:hypothetical protein